MKFSEMTGFLAETALIRGPFAEPQAAVCLVAEGAEARDGNASWESVSSAPLEVAGPVVMDSSKDGNGSGAPSSSCFYTEVNNLK